MTGRERLTNIINRRPADRLSWTTLIDGTTLSAMPEGARAMSSLDFYRHIGCDILQFGNYGLPAGRCVRMPFKYVGPETKTEDFTDTGGRRVVESISRWGTLTWASKNGHPVKYAVETIEDLRVYRNNWQATRVEEEPGAAESFERAEAAIGADGIYAFTLEPSPVQRLIEIDMGMANFYYLLQDFRREMEELLAVMHGLRMQEYEIVARDCPAEVVIPVENTSSTLTSPAIYERYSLPQISDLVRVMHSRGKKVVLHMCGLLKDLLPIIRQTRLDGINAVTPPTVGDTPYGHVLDVMGEDFPLFGAIFNGNVFQKPGVTRQEIWAELERTYTPRLRRANMVLWLQADGIPTPLENFLAVRDWMTENGRL